MRLAELPGRPHLTYCLNVHPGERVTDLVASVRAAGEVRAALVAQNVLPETSWMGVGLRLSGEAARSLDGDDAGLSVVRRALCAERLYAFTANAFPHGAFHGTRVKEAVYQPDWLEPARAAYTVAAARVLAALLDERAEGLATLSTVPVGFRGRVTTPAARHHAAGLLREVAGELARLRRRHGARVVLALEPEPACALETTAEALAFFQDHLQGRGADEARAHLGLCVDLCHAAVQGEDVEAALLEPQRAGVVVGKVQLSAGVELALPGDENPAAERRALEAVQRFDDGVYLHQVVEDGPSGRRSFVDLPEAVAALHARRRAGDGDARRWQVHAHVPIFLERAGAVGTTQPMLVRALDLLRDHAVTPHLEVETYTWDVLPSELRGASLPLDVAREMAWVASRLRPPADASRESR